MNRLMTAITRRNSAEITVPTTPPTVRKACSWVSKAIAVAAIATEARITTVEWPSEKKNPTPTGRCPACMSLRVTLSMAAM